MTQTNQRQDCRCRSACVIIFSFIVLFVCNGWAHAESLTGTREISIAGQMGQVKITEDYKYFPPPPYGGSGRSTDESKYTFMTLSLRFGWYVYHGIEIEPEIHLSSVEGVKSALSFHGNIVYNINAEKSPDKPQVIPFILAGYGIGNAVPFFHTFISSTTTDWDVGVFNLGVGTKVLITKHIAARTEYRYQRYTYDTVTFYSSTKYTHDFHSVRFGFSIFLPPRTSK